MVTQWLALAAEAIHSNEPLMLVTVCGVEGSAPREAGAKMLVTATRFHGTIGGGNLEFGAIARARDMLREDSVIAFEDFPLGPALAQCCGGRVRIGYERLAAPDLEWLQAAIEATAGGQSAILERDLGGANAHRRLSGANDGEERSFFFLDRQGQAIPEPIPPMERCAAYRERIADVRPHIYVFGAGHVGTAVVRILETMPATVAWIDRRAESFPPATTANVSITETGNEVSEALVAPPGAYFLIVTHSHDIDYELALAILGRGDATYCGLIGSTTKRKRFESRFRRAGLGDAEIARLICPIGANGLKGKSPTSIALSTVHEMFMTHEARRGGAAWN